MFCPECGHDCRNTARVCPQCGAELPSTEREDPAARLRSEKRRRLVSVCVAAMLALGAAAGAYFWWRGNTEAARAETAAIVLSDIDNEKLRTYIADLSDADSDGFVSKEEAAAVTAIGSLNADGSVADPGVSGMGIADLSIVSKFPQLEVLVCDNNELKSLDLGSNSHLKKISCRNNRLANIMVPKSTTELYATGNELAVVDLAGASELEVLELDEGVSVGGDTVDPSDADFKQILTLAGCYITALDPAGTLQEGDSFGDEASASSYLIATAVDPGTLSIWWANAAGEMTQLTDAPAESLGIEKNAQGAFDLTDEQLVSILSSFDGEAPSDLASLSGAGLLQSDGSVWTLAVPEATVSHGFALRDISEYGRYRDIEVVARYPNQDSNEGYTDNTYEMTLKADDTSLFGFHIVSCRLLSSEANTGDSSSDSGSSGTAADETASANDLSGLTGYLMAVNSGVDDDSYSVVSSELSDDAVVIDARFGYEKHAVSSWNDISKYLPRATYTLSLANNCSFYSSGGDAGRTEVSRADFAKLLDARNGLGLTIHIVDGTVDWMELAS